MATRETGRLGKRGTFVIPAGMRKRLGLAEGTLVIAEERPEGILLRPAIAIPTEAYAPQRQAAFLLENAVDADDYTAARKAVRQLGLDPDAIPHFPPGKSRANPRKPRRSRA